MKEQDKTFIENLENISTRLSNLSKETTELKKELIEKHKLLEHRLNKLEKNSTGKTPLDGVFPTEQEKIIMPSEVDEYLDKFDYSTDFIKEKTKNLYKYSKAKTEINLNTSYLTVVIETILGKYILKDKQEKMLYLTKDLCIMYNTKKGDYLIDYTFDIDFEYFKKLLINYLKKFNIPLRKGSCYKPSKEQFINYHFKNKGDTNEN